MTETDHNGIRIKPDHHGSTGFPFGEYVWLLQRHDDKLYGVWGSRHEAVGARATEIANSQEEWFEPIRVRSGTVRMNDVIMVSDK